ncbi:MAG TPA: lysophospholipid acyltransferase family protein [Hyphomicrobiales bacterium]|nr:lysophospholipid acyltransferase family protein [Hyphomicrobiales bacterium]
MAATRAVLLTAALAAVSLVGIPLQALALATGSPLARTIPVLYHRIVGRLAGIRRTVVGRPAEGRPLLLAGNHVSWLDIPVLSAVLPVSFVAKREVASWPVFGLFAKLQRSVFVDRERRSLTAETAAEMAGRLAEGDVLMLFAEGTSGDHNRVLPFRTALIGAARAAIAGGSAATVWVQPVSIAYTRWNGLPVGRRERPRLAWYGDMDLGPHLWRVLKEGRIDAVVTFGAPIAVGQDDDRKAVAALAEASVRAMTRAAQRGEAVSA